MSGRSAPGAPQPWGTARLVGLGAGSAVALSIFAALGRDVPGPPLALSAAPWSAWASDGGAAGVVMGLVRVLALTGTGYLLAVVVLELAGRSCTASGLLRASRRLCLPGMASWLSQAAAAGVVASVVATSGLAAGPAGATAPPSGVVVMHQLPPSTTTLGPAGAGPDGTARSSPHTAGRSEAPPVMQVVGPSPTGAPAPDPTSTPPSSTTTMAATSSTAGTATPSGPGSAVGVEPPSTTGPSTTGPSTTGPSPATTAAPPPATTWTIRPGDHLWRVASTTLTRRWGVDPTDVQVLGYLHDLIALNRDRLVVAGDPDLVFPGQTFVLPPVPVEPA